MYRAKCGEKITEISHILFNLATFNYTEIRLYFVFFRNSGFGEDVEANGYLDRATIQSG